MPYFYIVHLDAFGIIIEIHCIRAGLFDKIMHDIVMHLLETYHQAYQYAVYQQLYAIKSCIRI